MNTAVTSLPLKPATPAFDATVAAAPRRWLAQAGTALWKAFEASGRARAESHLRDLANRFEATQPELAKELRLAASRQEHAA